MWLGIGGALCQQVPGEAAPGARVVLARTSQPDNSEPILLARAVPGVTPRCTSLQRVQPAPVHHKSMRANRCIPCVCWVHMDRMHKYAFWRILAYHCSIVMVTSGAHLPQKQGANNQYTRRVLSELPQFDKGVD